MQRQADIFYHGEGDAWLERNRERLGKRDLVMDVLESERIKPTRVLEIGCANGWRLKRLRMRYECQALGVDPSRKATHEDAHVRHGTAVGIPFDANPPFDLIIFGFCLYLVDRADLFRVAANADDFLADGGHLIIHDFVVPDRPFCRAYAHRDGVKSYHMHHAGLWEAHPYYKPVISVFGEDEQVDLLRKDMRAAFPEIMPP